MTMKLEPVLISTVVNITLTPEAAVAVADLNPSAIGDLIVFNGSLCIDAIQAAASNAGVNVSEVDGFDISVKTTHSSGVSVSGEVVTEE